MENRKTFVHKFAYRTCALRYANNDDGAIDVLN